MDGHCLCGAVSWACEGEATWSALCHCETCRRNTSAPVAAFIGLLREDFSWTGADPAAYASSPGVERLFCPSCGSAMAFVGGGYPDEIFLLAATLSDPSSYAPDMHVHYAERLPWLHIDDDLPKLTGSNEDAKS